MLTRFFLIAVFWYAVFRFLGRVLRFFAAPSGAARGRPVDETPGSREAMRAAEPHRASSQPAWDRREVIDVDYEEVSSTPGDR